MMERPPVETEVMCPETVKGPCSSSKGWASGRGGRLLHSLPAVLGLVLLVAAVVVIQREVRHISIADLKAALHGIPTTALLAGAGCTLLSYFVLSFYDYLACINVGARQPYRRAAFAAFCSYVLSHNLGFAAVSGAAVRFRLYRNWKLNSGAIARIIAFCSTTYLLGAGALIGGVLLLEPGSIPLMRSLPTPVLRLAGLAFWALVLGYVVRSFVRRGMCLGRYSIELPHGGIAIAQVLVSAADMVATALIAYVLIPAGTPIGFGAFLAIYLASYTAGLLASVPGGLGVFDSAMLLALSPYLPTPQILGVILVFRLFYYIVPLVLAGVMFAAHEIFLRGEAALVRARAVKGDDMAVRRPSHVIRQSEADFSVAVASGIVSVTGVLLVFYAVVAPIDFRHPGLASLFAQSANVLLCFLGVVLVGMAIGLSQRVTLAWKATLWLLGGAIALLMVRQAPLSALLGISLVMFLIAPFRSCYYRRARLLVDPFCPAMVGSLTLWVLSLVWLGLFALRRHLGAAWWHALIYDAHTAVARWALVVSATLVLLAVVQMVRRGRIPIFPWDEATESRYRRLSHALEDLGPRLPSGFLIDESGHAGVPFLRAGRFIIGLGDPAGDERACVAAIWRLRDFALQEGRHPAFLYIGDTFVHAYHDIGMTVLPDCAGSGYRVCGFVSDIATIQAFLQDRPPRRFTLRLKPKWPLRLRPRWPRRLLFIRSRAWLGRR